ncbi:MAG: sensor histidine kinase, partial [Lachnospira sp.]
TGSGFGDGKKAEIDDILDNYNKQETKLEGNSIGIINVQKRIKFLCGKQYGLSYTENEGDGVTAHIILPWKGEIE